MKVLELIDFLKTQPQDLQVAYKIHSEQCLLEADKITVKTLCKPRPDGWIQDYRLDTPAQEYLVFPGN